MLVKIFFRVVYPFTTSNSTDNIFWHYLFIPDLISRAITYLALSMNHVYEHKLLSTANFLILFTTCIYFPILYTLTWLKMKNFKGNYHNEASKKIYIILSASSSNLFYVLATMD